MIKEVIKMHQHRQRVATETIFFRKNRFLLKKYPFWEKYYLARTRFDIICANIIIKALLNKAKIEEYYEEYQQTKGYIGPVKEKILTLPHFETFHQKIFVPIFNRANNMVYFDNLQKLGEYPYTNMKDDIQSLRIQPFDYYGQSLFSEQFTSLVLIASDETSACYFHFEYEALFFINNQGSLDYEIYLFDRYLKKQDHGNIIERVTSVAKAYFELDRDELVRQLQKEGFISTKLAHKIFKSLASFYKKRNRILGKGVANVEI